MVKIFKIGYNIIGDIMVIKYVSKNIDEKPKSMKVMIIEFLLYLLLYTLVLMLASVIFENFYIDNFGYALLASLIIVLFNKTLKPILIIFTLPLTILTVGLFYPFINVIILKLTSLLIGEGFIVKGWIVPFFITLFV